MTEERFQFIIDIDGTVLHSVDQLRFIAPESSGVLDDDITKVLILENPGQPASVLFAHLRLFLHQWLEMLSKQGDLYIYSLSGHIYARYVNEHFFFDDTPDNPFASPVVPEARVFSLLEQVNSMVELGKCTSSEIVDPNLLRKSIALMNYHLVKIGQPPIDRKRAMIFDDRFEMWSEIEDQMLLVHMPTFEGQHVSFDSILQHSIREFRLLLEQRAQWQPERSLAAQWHITYRANVLKNCIVHLHQLQLCDYHPFFNSIDNLVNAIKLLGGTCVMNLNEGQVPTHIVFGRSNRVTLPKKMFLQHKIHMVHLSWLVHCWFFRCALDPALFMLEARPEFAFTELPFVIPIEKIQQIMAQKASPFSALQNWYQHNPIEINTQTFQLHLECEPQKLLEPELLPEEFYFDLLDHELLIGDELNSSDDQPITVS